MIPKFGIEELNNGQRRQSQPLQKLEGHILEEEVADAEYARGKRLA